MNETIPPELLTIDSLMVVGTFIKQRYWDLEFLNQNQTAAVLWDWIQTHIPDRQWENLMDYPIYESEARNWEHYLSNQQKLGNTYLDDTAAYLLCALDEHLPPMDRVTWAPH